MRGTAPLMELYFPTATQQLIMLNYNYSVYSFLLLLHSLPSLAIVDPVDYTDPYIFYNGTIAGKFVPNPSTVSSLGCGDNGTYYFSDLASVFKFGVNSPSNNNAFFFEIKHRGDEWTKNCGTPCVIRRSSTDGSSNTLDSFSKRDIYICANPWGCTSDAVYNLYFKSLSVNLSAAAVTRVSGVPISDDDGGPFYVVSGDETTRLNNKTLGEDFNYQKPRNYSSEDRDCTDELVYHWLVPFLMQAIFKGLKVPSGTNNERIGSLPPSHTTSVSPTRLVLPYSPSLTLLLAT